MPKISLDYLTNAPLIFYWEAVLWAEACPPKTWQKWADVLISELDFSEIEDWIFEFSVASDWAAAKAVVQKEIDARYTNLQPLLNAEDAIFGYFYTDFLKDFDLNQLSQRIFGIISLGHSDWESEIDIFDVLDYQHTFENSRLENILIQNAAIAQQQWAYLSQIL
jgi:hypothetical protein